jgi:hypothetical protein
VVDPKRLPDVLSTEAESRSAELRKLIEESKQTIERLATLVDDFRAFREHIDTLFYRKRR